MAPPGSPLYAKGVARGPEGEFESDAINDRLPDRVVDHADELPVGASQLHARRRRGLRRQQDRRDRRESRRLGEDGVHSHVRRERRPVRSRRAAGAARGHAARVRCTGFRSAPAIAFRRSSFRPGPRVAGYRSQPFDHTSSLRLLERITGVEEPNITEWRRKTFGDFTSVFRFDDAKSAPPSLPDTSGPLVLARREATSLPAPALVGQPQAPPSQETGTRRRVP